MLDSEAEDWRLVNSLTNNQNELENISGAPPRTLSEDEFEKGIITATDQIFQQRGKEKSIGTLVVIGRAYRNILKNNYSERGVLLSAQRAIKILRKSYSKEKLEEIIEGLEDSGEISLEFSGVLRAVLNGRV